jgi:hypothetical protein
MYHAVERGIPTNLDSQPQRKRKASELAPTAEKEKREGLEIDANHGERGRLEI